MSGAHSISTRRAYGVQRVCRVWARPRSSVYAQRQAPATCARGRRRGPVGAASDEVLVTHIRRVLSASPFHGEGYRGSSHKCVHDSAPAGRPRRGKRVRMRSCQLTSGEVVCRSVDGRLRGPHF